MSIGTLARPKTNPATGKITSTKVFDLMFKVTENDKRLKPGLSATVDIIVDRLSNVVYVPIESVFTTDNNRTFVYLRKKGDKVEKRLVEIGRSNDLHVKINIVMGAIAAVSLRVGGIGIMKIMLATVTERMEKYPAGGRKTTRRGGGPLYGL